jgi:anaerobic dimethyl sulfoxide reductase subunit B (iron-sulfur subunit)
MMKKQYAFYVDSSHCSGCKTCQAACIDKNNLERGMLWRRVYEVNEGEWIKKGNAWVHKVQAYNVSLSCNHCDNPLCVKNCPTNAMHKDKNGIVSVDENKCIGCRYCEWSCPYGAPKYNEAKGVMGKCNLCVDFLEEGKSPACVAACPMRVLEFGELDELRKKYGTINEVYPLPKGTVTSPSVVIKLHKDAIPADSLTALINNKEEV